MKKLISKILRLKKSILILFISSISLIIFMPTFTTNFLFDDYNLLYKIRTNGFSLNYYSHLKNSEQIQDMKDKGLIPFYADTDAKLNFFRPIPSILLYAKYKIFGLNPFFYRIVNFILYILCGVLVFIALRKIINENIALLTLSIFIISKTNISVLSSIHSIDEIIVVIFILLSFINFINFDKENGNKYFFYSIFFTILALLTKENGIYSIVINIGYALIISSSGNIKSKIRANLISYCILIFTGLVYLAFYLLSGYGANSLEYITPLTPFNYILYVPSSFLLNFLSLFMYVPQRALNPSPLTSHFMLSIVSVFLLLVILVGIFLFFRKNKNVRFFWFILITPMLIAVGHNPCEKLLFLSNIGFSAIFANLIYSLFKKEKKAYIIIFLRNISICLLMIFFILSPVYTFYVLTQYKEIGKMYDNERASINSAMGKSYLSWRKLILVLNHKYRFTLEGFHYALFLNLNMDYLNFHFLNINPFIKVNRSDKKTLTIESYKRYDDALFGKGESFELPYLTKTNFKVGEMYETKHYTVYIMEVRKGLPVKISVNLKIDLSDPSLVFLQYDVVSNSHIIKTFTPEGLFR